MLSLLLFVVINIIVVVDRDIAANFLGGMLLLFNEPFTPGIVVVFVIIVVVVRWYGDFPHW